MGIPYGSYIDVQGTKKFKTEFITAREIFFNF